MSELHLLVVQRDFHAIGDIDVDRRELVYRLERIA